jgi:hypothetical protein
MCSIMFKVFPPSFFLKGAFYIFHLVCVFSLVPNERQGFKIATEDYLHYYLFCSVFGEDKHNSNEKHTLDLQFK